MVNKHRVRFIFSNYTRSKIAIKNAILKWGKWHKPGNTGEEIQTIDVNSLEINCKETIELNSCGKYYLTEGCEGQFSLAIENKICCTIYFDCPWIGKNQLNITPSDDYIVIHSGEDLSGPNLGDIKITVYDKEIANNAVTSGFSIGNNESDPNSSGVDLFRNPRNQPNALATLLNNAQQEVNFNPATQGTEEAAQSFIKYLEKISKIPYLQLKENTRAERSIREKNYQKLIDGISSLYTDIKGFDMKKLKESLGELANTVLGSIHAKETRSYFGQFSIVICGSDVKLYVYYTQLTIERNATSKKELIDQKFVVNISEYKLLTEVMASDAELLSRLHKTTAEEWLKGVTSKQNPNITPCFLMNDVEESQNI